MNILLVSVLKPDAPSGVRVHYLALAAGLRRQGHTVDVVTPADLTGWRRRAVAVLRHLLRRLGAVGQALANPLSDYLHLRWAIAPARRYDVVNAQDAASGLAATHALDGRVPVVVTGHHNDHPAADDLRQRPRPAAAARALHRWHNHLLARTRYFAAVSDYGLACIRPSLPATALCRTLYNGIDFEKFAAPATGTGPQWPGRHLLLNIGQLEGRKNQRLLIETAHCLRQLRSDFVIGLVGQGPDAPALLARIAALGLTDQVQLLGYQESVAALLAQASLYVHTATHETFGLVLVEAVAAGVPALALAVGGVPEVLAATPEALLPPAIAPEALAQQLNTWLTAAEARAALHHRQLAHARAHFAQPRHLAETLRFLKAAQQHFQQQNHPTAAPQPEPWEKYRLGNLA